MNVLRALYFVRVPAESREAFRRDVPFGAVRAAAQVLMVAVGAQLCLALGGTKWQLSLLYSAPHLGLLLSLPYVRLGRGRSPLAMLFWPLALSHLLLALLVLPLGVPAPANPEAAGVPWWTMAGVFAVLVCAAHALASMAAPSLSTVYGLVYPFEHRGRLVAYVRMIHGLAGIATAALAGWWFAGAPERFRVVYPVFALATLWLIWRFCRMPLSAAAAAAAHERTPPTVWSVLRGDRAFRRFQLYQFLLGFANLSAQPMVAVYVRERLDLDIDLAVLVVANGVIVQAANLFTVRYQGRLFERLGVIWHRVMTSALMGLGFVVWAFADNLPLAALAALFMGLGMAGGQIIWMIGSLSFAPPGAMSVYSGIHTFLTGLRGMVAPLAGVWLLESGQLDGDYRTFFLIAAGLIFISVIGHATHEHDNVPANGRGG